MMSAIVDKTNKRKRERKMKVITKHVEIENEAFVLIKDEKTDCNGEHYEFYGTIPYAELDEKGYMKRALNGFDMCIADTANEALARRKDDIKTDRAIKEYMAQGYSENEAIMKAFGF